MPDLVGTPEDRFSHVKAHNVNSVVSLILKFPHV